jgi:hypothetical protein
MTQARHEHNLDALPTSITDRPLSRTTMQTVSAPILRLSVLARHGETSPHGASARFDAHGGSIGSDPDNVLTLDRDDRISGRHAAVDLEHGAWRLSNTSLHTAIAHNGRLLPPGGSAALRDGDIVNIGASVLRASIEETVPGWHTLAEPRAATTVTGHAGAAPADYLPHDLADLLNTPVDPLALFGAPQATWDGLRGAADRAPAPLDNWLAEIPTTPARSAAVPSEAGSALRDATPEFLSHIYIGPVVEPRAEPPAQPGETEAPAAAASPVDSPGEPPVMPPVVPVPVLASACETPATPTNGASSAAVHTAAAGISTALRYGTSFGVPAKPHDAPGYMLRDPAMESRQVLVRGTGLPESQLPDAMPMITDPLVFAAPGAPNLPLLAQAFLDGAGIAAADAEAAGFTPEYMRGLGALARGLKLLLPDR